MAERYQYNYKPSGENVNEIVNWLKNQHDKGYSLNLLIRKAIHQYGIETDLKQYMTDRFINDGYQTPIQPSTQPTVQSQQMTTSDPTTTKTNQIKKQNPQPQQPTEPSNSNPNNFLQKSQDDDQVDSAEDQEDMPNFGFLSKNNS